MLRAPLPESRLLLVEGLPGSGKSTTAQWLCHLLKGQGRQATWYHEQDAHHPIYRDDELQAATRGGCAACEAYHVRARERWKAFVAAASGREGITIFESSFFQSPIASMQLARCSREAIARHVSETEAIVAPLHPLLIVLGHDDPEDVYRHIRERRGPEFEPFLIDLVSATPYGEAASAATPAGILALLREHASALRESARRVEMHGIEVDVSQGRWTESRLTIAAFLDLPVLDPYRTVDEPLRFLGRYRDRGSEQELVVASDERGLFLDATGTRLLPTGEGAFELEGLPVELAFDGAGAPAGRMHITSQLSDIGPTWERA
jgi:hypothetical protein